MPPCHLGTELHIITVALLPPVVFDVSKLLITAFFNFKFFNDFFIVLIVSITPTLVKGFRFSLIYFSTLAFAKIRVTMSKN